MSERGDSIEGGGKSFKISPDFRFDVISKGHDVLGKAFSMLSRLLPSETEQEPSTHIIPLMQPEGSTRTDHIIPGRFDNTNRGLLNRLYGLTGAEVAHSIAYSHIDPVTKAKVAEVVEVPVGTNSRFLELTSGTEVGGVFMPETTRVLFKCNTPSEME